MSVNKKIFEGEADVYRMVCERPRITIASLKDLFPSADVIGMVKKWEKEQWVSFSCMGDNPGLMAADNKDEILSKLNPLQQTNIEAQNAMPQVDSKNNEDSIMMGWLGMSLWGAFTASLISELVSVSPNVNHGLEFKFQLVMGITLILSVLRGARWARVSWIVLSVLQGFLLLLVGVTGGLGEVFTDDCLSASCDLVALIFMISAALILLKSDIQSRLTRVAMTNKWARMWRWMEWPSCAIFWLAFVSHLCYEIVVGLKT